MKTKKALATGLCGANCPGCIQKTHICWFEREKPVCHSFVSALERCAFLPVLPGRCCRCAYSQNPRLSRGLEEALEGHITDNAPQGASNGSASCIADLWQAPYGAFYLCLGILATRKRVNKLFQAHLIRYLIFVKLMLDVLRNLLLISPYCVNIVFPCPEVPISILVFQVRVSVEYILPSEKAKAYEMKLEATRRKAGIPLKINSGQVDQNFSQPYSVEKVADEAGESVKQVQRFIRLNKLTPDLMQPVDDGRLKTTPVVELSYLTPEEQEEFFSYMEEEGCTPSLSQAQMLKAASEESVLTKDKIHGIMSARAPSVKPREPQLTIAVSKVERYFPKGFSSEQMESTILKLLENYYRKRQDYER